jgi:two-component system sensor histidine kinase KdpD
MSWEQKMSDGATDQTGRDGARRLPLGAQYVVALIFVALAAVLALVVEHLIAAPNLTLIFVLPVVVAATSFGLGPSLAAAAAGVLTFDFFFTEPRYSFRIASASDIWAAALLLVIAAIVSTVAAESRRRAMEAARAVEQAQALERLAHAVIAAQPQGQILQAAARALNQIFQAPAVIFAEQDGRLAPVAEAGGAEITSAVTEAAEGALKSHLAARSETYPYDRSPFDLWPVETPARRYVLGVDFTRSGRERPAKPQRFVDVVGGYLAAAPAGG